MTGEPAGERGERERFRQLYLANQPPLSAYALRRTATPEDAADLVAEVFAVAWRRLVDVPRGRDGTLWLYGVARHLLANQRRGGWRRERLLQRLWTEPPEKPPELGEAACQSDAIRRAFAQLSDRQRDLLGLVAWEGLSTVELARVLDCSENAAKIRLHRARKRLGVELRRAGVEVTVGPLPEHERPKPDLDAGHEREQTTKSTPIVGEAR